MASSTLKIVVIAEFDLLQDMEADEVESDCDGPERLLDAWLGELDTLTGVSSDAATLHAAHWLRRASCCFSRA